jgi:hypothetical protein
MSDFHSILLNVTAAAIVGLVAWVWTLWRSLTDLRLKVAEEYIRHSSVDEIKDELHALRDVVYRIALKMDVPVFTEPFRR